MSRVTLIQHINIQVVDREKTREFYEKVLGAEFLDRGPEMNKRQLQLRIGNGEIHTNDTREAVLAPAVHFAVEIDDWDEMIANMDDLGVPYSTSPLARSRDGVPSSWGNRDYSGGHYCYVQDPNGNVIELVQHPMGLEDAEGNKIEVKHHAESPRWAKHPEYNTAPGVTV